MLTPARHLLGLELASGRMCNSRLCLATTRNPMQLKPLLKGRFQPHWQAGHDLIEQVVSSCITERRLIPEGEPLMRQGEPLRDLVLVKSGRIAMGHTAMNGRRFQLGTLECDHQLFGEMEFFTGYRCQLDIIAEEPLAVARIDGEQLEQALVAHPKVALFFATAIAIDYQDTVDIFTCRMLYPISYNIALDLYHSHCHHNPVSGFRKGYQEAERFGTTDRVYRRAVKELMDKGLVERGEEGLQIRDLAGLKAFLEQP